MSQFFDVFTDRVLIDASDVAGMDFVMRAPLSTIAAVYSLHRDAQQRVARNAGHSKATVLYGNGKRANLFVCPVVFDAPSPTCAIGA